MSRTTRGGHDVLTLTGIGVVAVAAAVMSFSSLHALGQRAGFGTWLAALLPIAIDAMVVVATRAWLLAETPRRARRHARLLALTAIGLSVVGNAGEHYMAAYRVDTPWWVVVAVAAVPPAALAATVHLAALFANERVASTSTPTRPVEAGSTQPVEAGSTLDESTLDASTSTRRSFVELREMLEVEVEAGRVDPTNAESIRKTLRCSAKRARELRDTASEPHLVAA